MSESAQRDPEPRLLLVVGSVNRDYVCRVPKIPLAGETMLGSELSLTSGGKGGNQAVAAAKMGGPTALVACVGADADGEVLLDDLTSVGVDTDDVVVVEGVRTGAAFVAVADDGENAIVVSPGANARLSADIARSAVARRLRTGDVLVLQAEIPLDAVVAATSRADQVGARVVLNLAPYREVPAAVLHVCDPLVLNEGEARALLRLPRAHRGGPDPREMAAQLGKRSRSVVITLGSAGAVLAEGGCTTQVSAPSVAVVDSTGAGDAFTGALAAELGRGSPLRAAVELGVAAGSHAVGRAGAQASYPTLSELAGS